MKNIRNILVFKENCCAHLSLSQLQWHVQREKSLIGK